MAFLDSAASAQKPQIVIDAMSEVMQSHYANIHRGLYDYSQRTTARYEEARHKVASFLGAQSDNEIVFTRNATEAINLVAQCWARNHLKPGDEVIVSALEHHANIVPWQMVSDHTGAVIKVVPIKDDGALDMDAYLSTLSTKTRIVSIVHISNAIGVVNDVKTMIQLARNYSADIKVLIDGSQSVVHKDINMSELGADFFVFTGHKLYGPSGIGVLWGREALLNAMPPYQGGGDMIESVSFEDGSHFKKAPSRFEAGTPAIVEAIGLGAAIDYVQAIGLDNIIAHEDDIYKYLRTRIDEIDGLVLYGDVQHKAPIISFTAEWGHISDIATILDQCGVAVRSGHHCAMPLMERLGVEGTIRASIGLYTDKDDIDQFIDALKKAQKFLA